MEGWRHPAEQCWRTHISRKQAVWSFHLHLTYLSCNYQKLSLFIHNISCLLPSPAFLCPRSVPAHSIAARIVYSLHNSFLGITMICYINYMHQGMYMREASYNTIQLHYTPRWHPPTTNYLLPKKLNFIKYVVFTKHIAVLLLVWGGEWERPTRVVWLMANCSEWNNIHSIYVEWKKYSTTERRENHQTLDYENV